MYSIFIIMFTLTSSTKSVCCSNCCCLVGQLLVLQALCDAVMYLVAWIMLLFIGFKFFVLSWCLDGSLIGI